MSPLRAAVRAIFPSFSARYEGDISWPYKDVRGLITVGLGCLIDPVDRALGLPWVDAVSRRPVTRATVRAEWARLKAMASMTGAVAARQRDVTSIRLTPEGIEQLAHVRLDATVQGLLGRWPSFGDMPANVQLVLCSMAWALGTGKLIAEFPKFGRHIDAGNWGRAEMHRNEVVYTGAAAECLIRVGEKGDPDYNPGVIGRNSANRALLVAATRAAAEGADPGQLYATPDDVPRGVLVRDDVPDTVPGAQQAHDAAGQLSAEEVRESIMRDWYKGRD